MFNRVDVVAAHRELVEASNGVRHLLVVEDITAEKINEARTRLARAYERVTAVDDELLRV
jgi:hypothetical protein